MKKRIRLQETYKQAPSLGYRPEIDGLRAVAVVAVIINHFNKSILPSGYLGVDIFFVISGFVITGSLGRHAATSVPPRKYANKVAVVSRKSNRQ